MPSKLKRGYYYVFTPIGMGYHAIGMGIPSGYYMWAYRKPLWGPFCCKTMAHSIYHGKWGYTMCNGNSYVRLGTTYKANPMLWYKRTKLIYLNSYNKLQLPTTYWVNSVNTKTQYIPGSYQPITGYRRVSMHPLTRSMGHSTIKQRMRPLGVRLTQIPKGYAHMPLGNPLTGPLGCPNCNAMPTGWRGWYNVKTYLTSLNNWPFAAYANYHGYTPAYLNYIGVAIPQGVNPKYHLHQ